MGCKCKHPNAATLETLLTWVLALSEHAVPGTYLLQMSRILNSRHAPLFCNDHCLVKPEANTLGDPKLGAKQVSLGQTAATGSCVVKGPV